MKGLMFTRFNSVRLFNWAYPPLLLFKCLLIQKWFQIKSDPELENQINDRISFKQFLELPLDIPSPDHSTFSRFRGRLSKDAMDQIHPVKYDLSLLPRYIFPWCVLKYFSRRVASDILRQAS